MENLDVPLSAATSAAGVPPENGMTQEQVALVQKSFAKVAPIADRAAVMFYDRLFEVAPQVKSHGCRLSP